MFTCQLLIQIIVIRIIDCPKKSSFWHLLFVCLVIYFRAKILAEIFGLLPGAFTISTCYFSFQLFEEILNPKVFAFWLSAYSVHSFFGIWAKLGNLGVFFVRTCELLRYSLVHLGYSLLHLGCSLVHLGYSLVHLGYSWTIISTFGYLFVIFPRQPLEFTFGQFWRLWRRFGKLYADDT